MIYYLWGYVCFWSGGVGVVVFGSCSSCLIICFLLDVGNLNVVGLYFFLFFYWFFMDFLEIFDFYCVIYGSCLGMESKISLEKYFLSL